MHLYSYFFVYEIYFIDQNNNTIIEYNDDDVDDDENYQPTNLQMPISIYIKNITS